MKYDFLKKLKLEEEKRIVDKLKQLEDPPAARHDVAKTAGEEETFRLRVGNYRALFKGLQAKKTAVVVKIGINLPINPPKISPKFRYTLKYDKGDFTWIPPRNGNAGAHRSL